MKNRILISILLILLCIGSASAEWIETEMYVDDTPDQVSPGDIVEFSIAILCGDFDESNVIMSYDPTELEYISSNPPYPHLSSGSIEWNSVLSPPATYHFSAKMKVIRTEPGEIITTFGGYTSDEPDELGEEWIYYYAQTTESTTVVTSPIPVPEYPSTAIPAIFVLGLIGIVVMIRKNQ